MKNKKKYLLIALSVLATFAAARAQEHSIGAGGNSSSASGSVSYTLGQIDYHTTSGSGGEISQGVQQPYEFFSISVEQEDGINLLMAAFPNPTTDYILLTIDHLENAELSFVLSDAHGKLLQQENNLLTSNQIQMINYPAGTYYLVVYDNLKELKSFKIIKN